MGLLQIILGLIGVYAVVLVAVPSMADRVVFAPLGFGAADHGVNEQSMPHLQLVTAVLGAVLLGWVIVMILIVRGPLAAGDAWAWKAVVVSLAVWFVADTAMSLARDYPTHALFNVAIVAALAVPLTRLRP